MPNNLDQIVDCLDQLLETEHCSGAALSDHEDHPSCVYLGSGPALYAEALGDMAGCGEQPEALVRAQPLNDLGWNAPLPGDAHWFRTWQVQSEAERLSAALQIQRTLAEAYGIGADQPLSVRYSSN